MKGRTTTPAPRKPNWAAVVVVDSLRVMVLLGTVIALILVAHSRLTGQELANVTLAQYGAVLGTAAIAFAMVPRTVRGTTMGYAGACALGGFIAVLALAWLVEVDLGALLATPAAAAERLADMPLRDVVSPAGRGAGPTLFAQVGDAALAVDPVYLALWAGIGAAGGAMYGWATRALR